MARKFTFSPGIFFSIAILLLILPFQWVFAMWVAALVHELFHLAALYLCKEIPLHAGIYAGLAKIQIPGMSRKKELFCTLAGPLGSLLLLLLSPWVPRIAICVAVQSAYNLLPIYPLDGGRALSCLLSMLLPPPRAKRVLQYFENGVLAIVLLLGIYGSFVLELGLLPLIIAITLYFRTKSGKMLAKRL